MMLAVVVRSAVSSDGWGQFGSPEPLAESLEAIEAGDRKG